MKKLSHSKTFWFGLFQIVFGIVGLFCHFIDSEAAMSLIVTGFGTIGFRLNVTQPIGTPPEG